MKPLSLSLFPKNRCFLSAAYSEKVEVRINVSIRSDFQNNNKKKLSKQEAP